MSQQLYTKLVGHFGSQGKTANALKVGQATVSGWVSGAHGMSAKTAFKAEQVTKGKFKAKNLVGLDS